jgi:hypothetical protein
MVTAITSARTVLAGRQMSVLGEPAGPCHRAPTWA